MNVGTNVNDIRACHEFSDRNGERVCAPCAGTERSSIMGIKRVVCGIRIRDRVDMAIYLHDKVAWHVTEIRLPIEEDTDCRRLRIRRHIEDVPRRRLVRRRGLRYIHQPATVGRRAVVERVIGKIAVCERPVKCEIIPGKRVNVLTGPVGRDTSFWTSTGAFSRVVVSILEPDQTAREAQVWIGDRGDFAQYRRTSV